MKTDTYRDNTLYTALLAAFCGIALLPVGAAYALAFGGPEGFTLAGFREVLAERRQWSLLVNTVLVAGSASALATVLGAPAGFVLARLTARRPRMGGVLLGILSAPFLMPHYILAVAWIEVLGTNGWVTRSLGWLGISGFPIYGRAGVILVYALTFYPLVMLAAVVGLRRFDGRLEEAARLSGSEARVFLGVTLPLLAPVLLSGTGFVFLFGLLSFSVPSLLQTPVYAVEIYTRFNSVNDPGGAILQSVPFLVFGVLAYGVWAGVLRPGYRRLGATPRPRTHLRPAGLGRALGLAYVGGLAGVSVVLPLAVLVARSLPLSSFAQAWATARSEILTSLALAGLSATAGVTLAFAMTCVEKRRLSRVFLLSALPFLVSGPVLGVGMIRLWNHHGVPGRVYDSFAIMVLACVAHGLVFAHYGLRAASRQLSPACEEAAAVHGAGPWRRALGIRLPLLRPALIAIWGLLFVLAVGELDAVLLVCPPGWTPLSVRLFTLMHYGPSSLVASLSLITLMLLFAGAALCVLAYAHARKWLDVRH